MSSREDYLKKMKAQFDEWNYKWTIERNKLEAKAQKAGSDVKRKYDQRIQELRHRRDDMKQRLGQIDTASENAWEDLKQGAEKAWETLNEALKKAKSHFE